MLVSILVIIVSIFLILIVLVQDSKGGGLASNFSAQNQVMGVRKTTDFLGKATWYLAAGLLVLSLLSVVIMPKGTAASGSIIEQKIQEESAPAPMVPDLPTPSASSDSAS